MPNIRITKPCHNCRRRRLRCDRSWPTCNKCTLSGQECLGYGKVFVWTQAIDSQGNPRPSPASGRRPGETGAFQPQAPPDSGGTRGDVAVGWALAGTGGLDPDQIHDVQVIYAEHAHDERVFRGHYQQQPLALRGAMPGKDIVSPGEMATTDKDVCIANTPNPDHQVDMPIRAGLLGGRSLTDPLFQDLDRTSRAYITHFNDRVCRDLVARDSDSNPFRELIPLTNRHPLLLQVLIATSAIHCCNLFRPNNSIPTSLTNPGDYLAQLRLRDDSSRQILIDALTAKEKAIAYLRQAMGSLNLARSEVGSVVALAAMHFFVKFDLIDFEPRVVDEKDGKEVEKIQGWRYHLEAASIVLELLALDPTRHASTRILRDCVIADCFIYHILGSTLAETAMASRIARCGSELLEVMKRVEVNSYLSCPPEILKIILSASQLSCQGPYTDFDLAAAEQARALIDEACAFDIIAWADQLRQLPNVTDIKSRFHVASAHRSAVCLYIIRALPVVRVVYPVDANILVNDILYHLGQIHDEDPYFKATSWPTFIAGAETRDVGHRESTLKRMFAIWQICPWGYIFAAIRMLKHAWQIQDANPESNVNWLQELKKDGYLIV
ncbi:acriflavine sensitivity control protein acr-2, partial [Metarhizium majus ARSEF 297]